MASPKVTFLGPTASFSHQAAVETFGDSFDLTPSLSFADAIDAVQEGSAEYAIVPFENSRNGAVVQVLDLLADRNDAYPDVKVYSEYYLTVHHCLMARKGLISGEQDYSSITKLYSHPQVWGQCEKFLSKYFNGTEQQDVSSTAKAAQTVLNLTSEVNAAIASRFAGEQYGLEILEENIEDMSDNTTRFLVLGNVKSGHPMQFHSNSTQKQPQTVPRTKKTLTSFMVRHDTPGSLADALLIFKEGGLNLTSISTRPSQIEAWNYIFLVESETDQKQDVVPAIMDRLRKVTKNCKHLGTWDNQLVSN